MAFRNRLSLLNTGFRIENEFTCGVASSDFGGILLFSTNSKSVFASSHVPTPYFSTPKHKMVNIDLIKRFRKAYFDFVGH